MKPLARGRGRSSHTVSSESSLCSSDRGARELVFLRLKKHSCLPNKNVPVCDVHGVRGRGQCRGQTVRRHGGARDRAGGVRVALCGRRLLLQHRIRGRSRGRAARVRRCAFLLKPKATTIWAAVIACAWGHVCVSVQCIVCVSVCYVLCVVWVWVYWMVERIRSVLPGFTDLRELWQSPRERRRRSALRMVRAPWWRLVRMRPALPAASVLAAPPCRRRDSGQCRFVQQRPARLVCSVRRHV
jgi:hypothetical protein